MNKLFYIKNGILLNSDWHIGHKKIWIYEFESRKKYIDNIYGILKKEQLESFFKDKTENEIEEFVLNCEYNLLLNIYFELENIIANNDIKEYINLGDFCLLSSLIKINTYKLTKNYKLLLDIFSLLKSNNIKTTLLLGNHDGDTNTIHSFFSIFFNDIKKNYFFKDGILYSHYPYLKENKIFSELNDTIIQMNIHGHTHSTGFETKNKSIKYINVCIDYFNKENQEI